MGSEKDMPVVFRLHHGSQEGWNVWGNGANTAPVFSRERIMRSMRKVKTLIVVTATLVILGGCATQTYRKPALNTSVSVFNNNRNRVKVELTKTDGYQILLLGRVETNAHDSFSLPDDYLHAYWRIRVETAITHQVWLSEVFQCSAHQEVTVNVNDVLRYTDFSIRDLEEGFDSLSTKKPGVP